MVRQQEQEQGSGRRVPKRTAHRGAGGFRLIRPGRIPAGGRPPGVSGLPWGRRAEDEEPRQVSGKRREVL